MVALPNLVFTITPPGGTATNYTSHLAYDGIQSQMSITQNFGRQGDTAVFVLVDDWQGHATPQIFIPVLSQVSLFDSTIGENLFSGVVNDPILYVDGANRNEWILHCTDYTFYADNAVVHGIFNGFSIDSIVVALTEQANCGISAAKIADGGFVAPAPSVNTINFNYATLSAAWRSLASQASSSSPYGWYVDQNRALHFYDSSTAQSSGVTLTTARSAPGSSTQGHILRDSQFQYEWDGTTIHNVIIVQGASQTVISPSIGPATNTFLADGHTDSWALKFTVTSVTKLLVGSKNTEVSLVEAGDTSTATWQAGENANGQWFLSTNSPPSAGTVLKIWYTYKVPIVAQAQNNASIATYAGPNGGRYVEYINDSSLTTASMALARAQAERQEYGFAVERATFNTDEGFIGWVRAGQTFQFVNSLLPDSQNGNQWTGINDTFLCVSNSVNFVKDGGYRQMQIQAVRI